MRGDAKRGHVNRKSALLGMATASLLAAPALAQNHLMRFADIHRDQIVFTYEGDLWLAWVSGGEAQRLTRSEGVEQFAKFSPDGKMIAFSASIDGDTDVYVMPTGGGSPVRLTYHPAADNLLDWFPDGHSILFRSRREYPFRVDMIYKVPVDGGLPEKLPVDQAGLTSPSPDGASIAYNRISREFATWKRHQGGTAQDIWVGSLEKLDYRPITDWVGTDSYPMWFGHWIYFISDRHFGTLNLYKYDLNTGETTALTKYKDYDVKYPSLGPNAIIFQYGEELHHIDLRREDEVHKIDVHIPTDRMLAREQFVSATDHAGSFRLSPEGKRLLLASRGELLDAPVKEGRTLNLTQSSGSREKSAAWSPDGKWIAFISDKAGDENLYLAAADGSGEWLQVTNNQHGLLLQPVWSPDSRYLLFSNKLMELVLLDVESGKNKIIDQGQQDDGWERWGIQDYVWSPDSRWAAYSKMGRNGNETLSLYSLDSGKAVQITDDWGSSNSPSFSPDGKYLYFLSQRNLNPVMCMIDQTHAFLNVWRPYLVVLAADGASPFAVKNDREEIAKKEEAKDKDGGAPKEEAVKNDADAKTTRIDVDGLERRILPVEGVAPGNYFRLEATDEGFLYLAKTENEFLKYQNINDLTHDKADLHAYSLKDRKERQLMGGIENYHLSPNGKKMTYRSGNTYGVVDVGANANVGDGKVDLSSARIRIDRLAEFEQMFHEAWRIERDFFYDPGMHGEDWEALGEKYARFLPDCGDRSDVNYLIGEMIGELNAGHTYVSGGAMPDSPPSRPTGLLGVDFESPPTAAFHRIRHVIPGNPWEPSERSPLAAPGCPIHEGDYVIAINGKPCTREANPYSLLEYQANQVVELAYNNKPSRDGAKTWLVKTLASENAIRYREWVDGRRRYVEEQSGGRIGYVHVPDMMQAGLIEFTRGFFPQHMKEAMIIDDRYNTGGFVGDMIIDRMERSLWAITQPREGLEQRNPERAFYGHYGVIINEATGSNGEYFAEAIQLKKLATIIGMRTWGGAVGIEPHQDLVDGGSVTPPQFAPYGLKGQWLIEGHGVDPDIEVQNMPGDVVRGKDAQLDATIKVLLDKIAKEPRTLPARPAYPVKTKPTE